MLIHYNHSTVTEAEKETMTVCLHLHQHFSIVFFFFLQYLHDELEKLRPILFRLATESEDGDEGLGVFRFLSIE